MAKSISYNNLLIVESPAKAKTINKYLGTDYKVMATVGHVIDLPKSKLGVDVENGYKPLFETIYGKAKILKDLKKATPKMEIFLAMDLIGRERQLLGMLKSFLRQRVLKELLSMRLLKTQY